MTDTLMEQVYELRNKALKLNAEALQCEEDAKEALRNEGVNPILRRRLARLKEKIGRVVIVGNRNGCSTSTVS